MNDEAPWEDFQGDTQPGTKGNDAPWEDFQLSREDNPGLLSRIGSGAMNDLRGLNDLASKAADVPVDIMEGLTGNTKPISEDVQSTMKGINELPEGIIKQAQEIGAQPLKMLPGKAGESFKKAYPGNPFIEHPINTAALLSPLAGEAVKVAEGIGKSAMEATDLPGYIEEYAQNASIRNAGGSPAQFRQLGPKNAHELGQYALDNDVTSITTGSRGATNKINEINEKAGQQIGDIRKLADTKGEPPNIEEIKNAVKQQLDPKYTKGISSGQAGTYAKALEELERAAPTHKGLSELATELQRRRRRQQNYRKTPEPS
jgi:hypothetical protein